MTHYQFSQIFLGFAAKDRYTVAESLLYHLENYGVPVWYDRHDLIIGDNRPRQIISHPTQRTPNRLN